MRSHLLHVRAFALVCLSLRATPASVPVEHLVLDLDASAGVESENPSRTRSP